MKFEIGDSVKFSKNLIKNLWKKGFVMGKVKTIAPNSKQYEEGFFIIEENGTVSTLEKTGIHLFSQKLFTSSKVLLCEKNISDLKQQKNKYVESMVLNILFGIRDKNE
jgi:hypothetical protein